jgi:hypothetical protein
VISVKNEAEKKEFLNVVLVIVFILCVLWEREKLESSEWKRELAWLVWLSE